MFSIVYLPRCVNRNVGTLTERIPISAEVGRGVAAYTFVNPKMAKEHH